jgi:hypothetical protein
MYLFRNKASIYGEELLAPHPTQKLEEHPLSVVRDLPYWKPFLQPQPEDAPCRGDSGQLIMVSTLHPPFYKPNHIC